MNAPASPSRIIVLSTEFLAPGGIQAVSRSVLRALAGWAAGRSRVEGWSLLDSPDSPGMRGAGGKRLRLVRWVLRAAATRSRETLVVVTHAHLAPLALPLVARGARLAIYLHGVEIWRPLTCFEAWTFRRAAVVLANSQHTIINFRAANPSLASLPIVRCAPGIEATRPSASIDVWRAETDDVCVLTVGRLWTEERYKGHDELIDTWPQVLSAVPAARLLIVGDGDDRGRLEQRAADPAVHGSITLLGRVSREVLGGLYAACDLFAMPSRREGFGLVYLEAMSAGKPCLGAFGAAEEVIVPGLTGVLVDPTQPRDLLDAMVRLLRDPALQRRLGHAGQRRFEAEFTEERFAARLLAALGLMPAAAEDPPGRSGRLRSGRDAPANIIVKQRDRIHHADHR